MAIAAAGVGTWIAANAGTIAAVSTAASVAATSYSIYSQDQSAKAQTKAQEEQNKQTAIQVASSYGDLSPAEIDANRQANDAALAQAADAIQAKGRVNLFAAASGTMGGSIDSMLFDIDVVKSRNLNEVIRQRESGLLSLRTQAENMRQQAIGNQSRTAIERPSWIEGGIKIGSDLIGSASNYYDRAKTLDGLSKADQPKTKTNTQIKGGV